MSDMMASVSGVRSLADQLASLGPALSSAAPSGNFGAVLSQISSQMNALEGRAPAAAAATTTASLGAGAYASGYAGGQAVSAGSSPYAAPVSSGRSAGQAVVADAQQYLGVPYQWGSNDPSTGLDCSGLVQRVYSDLGLSLPRTSEEQATVGTPVSSLAQAQPGDLVFFGGNGYDGTPSSPGHVGIYIGNGMMIDAPRSGTAVQIDPVANPVAIRRILPATSAVPASSAYPLNGVGATLTSSYAPAGTTSAAMDSLGVPANLQPLFASAGARYNVDPLLLASVAKQESGFQTGAVSGAGAQGVMQLMPGTAAGLGVSAFDPAQAIDGAAQLLSGYLQSYGGSVPLALAAYNAGPGAVSQYGGIPPYAETQNYVSNITSMLASASAVTL